jgi:hypothetical protein
LGLQSYYSAVPVAIEATISKCAASGAARLCVANEAATISSVAFEVATFGSAALWAAIKTCNNYLGLQLVSAAVVGLQTSVW